MVIAVGLGIILEALVSHWLGPLPISARFELFAAGGLLMAPLFFLGGEARKTTYAVTTERLLMAVGPDRGQIREVTLAELGPARISRHRYYGRVLEFKRRGPHSALPVWTFLDGRKTDKWFAPWTPDDPEAVRQLIETASNHYWFDARKTNRSR
jgi:hypothetical protein